MPATSTGVSPQPPEPEQAGCLSTIARIIWIMAGNFALIVILGLIAMRKSFSHLDAIYWLIVAALLFIRYADIRWLKGQGSDAQRATMRDWVRYARLLLILAGGAWVAARIVLLLLVR